MDLKLGRRLRRHYEFPFKGHSVMLKKERNLLILIVIK